MHFLATADQEKSICSISKLSETFPPLINGIPLPVVPYVNNFPLKLSTFQFLERLRDIYNRCGDQIIFHVDNVMRHSQSWSFGYLCKLSDLNLSEMVALIQGETDEDCLQLGVQDHLGSTNFFISFTTLLLVTTTPAQHRRGGRLDCPQWCYEMLNCRQRNEMSLWVWDELSNSEMPVRSPGCVGAFSLVAGSMVTGVWVQVFQVLEHKCLLTRSLRLQRHASHFSRSRAYGLRNYPLFLAVNPEWSQSITTYQQIFLSGSNGTLTLHKYCDIWKINR